MFQWDFAISYAGEEEGIAADLFKLLDEKEANIFFVKDKNYKVDLLGKRLKPKLREIFGGPHTKFMVAIVSKHYVQKKWPKYEFNVAKRQEQKRGREFILPVRLDDVRLKGLEEDKVYIDFRKEGLFGAAEMLIMKLRERYPPEEIPVPRFWVVTFGVVVEEVSKEYKLPSSVPTDYPSICNWLEKDLMKRLSKSPLERLTLLEDSRDGETLSLRIGFRWNPKKAPFEFGDIGWWKFLEINAFNEIYPDKNPNEILVGNENDTAPIA